LSGCLSCLISEYSECDSSKLNLRILIFVGSATMLLGFQDLGVRFMASHEINQSTIVVILFSDFLFIPFV
jgi:hypothetical protein